LKFKPWRVIFKSSMLGQERREERRSEEDKHYINGR
jgi:hypothetical protein